MPHPSPADRELRSALAGVRALLLDLDGVIVLAGKPIPGSSQAVARLDDLGIPYRIVTNTSMVSRPTLARWAAGIGAAIPPERFQSALSVAAAWAATRYPDQPLYVLASEDARGEFAGQRLLTHEEAARPDAQAAAVIIGDSPEDATWDNLNRAFRLVRRGAQLVGMHKNRWWLTPEGPTLDSGAFVAGLEFAASTRAHIVGKPSLDFFRSAARDLAAEVRARGEPPLRRNEIAMVGDDVWSDALAPRRAGMRGILVLTGKHGEDELA
ncbi:MAG TPA: HAD-IIA family hydrolase, partial [Vitreimonas sp.]|nr:HAD-IIA family hydrolase [Vitreimonas sp.]